MTKMTVELLDSMGSDLTVCRAARVSMDKETSWIEGRFTEDGLWEKRLSDRDVALIRFLAEGVESKDKAALLARIVDASTVEEAEDIFHAVRNINQHFAPFAHCVAQFRLTVPLFVARQLWKSNVGASGGDNGGTGWSEVSKRYVVEGDSFYIPEKWRKRAANVKQGSSDEAIGDEYESLWQFENIHEDYSSHLNESSQLYNHMVDSNAAPEQARMVLPQSAMVTFWWTGSLLFFARVCRLRLDPHAQRESQEVAEMISEEMARLYPVSWAALMNGVA